MAETGETIMLITSVTRVIVISSTIVTRVSEVIPLIV